MCLNLLRNVRKRLKMIVKLRLVFMGMVVLRHPNGGKRLFLQVVNYLHLLLDDILEVLNPLNVQTLQLLLLPGQQIFNVSRRFLWRGHLKRVTSH